MLLMFAVTLSSACVLRSGQQAGGSPGDLARPSGHSLCIVSSVDMGEVEGPTKGEGI